MHFQAEQESDFCGYFFTFLLGGGDLEDGSGLFCSFSLF